MATTHLIDYAQLEQLWDKELLRQITMRTDSPGEAVRKASRWARVKQESHLREYYDVPTIFSVPYDEMDEALQDQHLNLLLWKLHKDRSPVGVPELIKQAYGESMDELDLVRNGSISLDLPAKIDPEDDTPEDDIYIDSDPREHYTSW